MSKVTREKSLILAITDFLKRKGYAVAKRTEIDELEIHKGDPSEKKSDVIDFTQTEFLAVFSISNASKWELSYQDPSNKNEVFKLAAEICEVFKNHVLISPDFKKVNN